MIKARVLTGIYILQTNRLLLVLSGAAVEPTCQPYRLEEEDIFHLVTCCPAFHDIQVATM